LQPLSYHFPHRTLRPARAVQVSQPFRVRWGLLSTPGLTPNASIPQAAPSGIGIKGKPNFGRAAQAVKRGDEPRRAGKARSCPAPSFNFGSQAARKDVREPGALIRRPAGVTLLAVKPGFNRGEEIPQPVSSPAPGSIQFGRVGRTRAACPVSQAANPCPSILPSRWGALLSGANGGSALAGQGGKRPAPIHPRHQGIPS